MTTSDLPFRNLTTIEPKHSLVFYLYHTGNQCTLKISMDYGRRNNPPYPYVSNVFRTFVCVALTLLLCMHSLAYFWGPAQSSLDGDFSDVKYVVMQLSRGLTDVNRKHELLQGEMERISSALPQVAAVTPKPKDALEPSHRPNCQRQIGDILDYDRQITDYALESAGAKVIDTADTTDHVIYDSPVSWALHAFASWMCRECLGARAMLQPSTLPGECWAFKGSRGEATILLLGTVRVTGFSIEHIPPQISSTGEISSAPRLCQVEGLEFRGDPYPHDYGSFEYDKHGKPIQYFEVLHPTHKGFNLVKLRILNNWGHPVYTCIYRFRVHGELVAGQVPKPVGDDIDMLIENE